MLHARQRGAEEAIAHLGRVKDGVRPSGLEPAMKQALLYVHSQVPPYPPPPATSRYRRTGTLGRSITTLGSSSGPALSRVETVGSQTIGYIGTAVTYAPYVIDQHRQAFMHRGRWWTLQDVVAKSKAGVIRILTNAVQKLL